MQDTLNYIQENKQRYVDELFELLKIASISADPAYNQDVLDCAEKVAEHLKNAGADQVAQFRLRPVAADRARHQPAL